jgi:N utilization substance protein A
LAERLVEEGFLSYDDLSVIEPDALMAMGELSEEEVATIVEQAEERALEAEAAAQDARRRKREEDRLQVIEAEFQAAEAAGRNPEDEAAAALLEGVGGAESAEQGDGAAVGGAAVGGESDGGTPTAEGEGGAAT